MYIFVISNYFHELIIVLEATSMNVTSSSLCHVRTDVPEGSFIVRAHTPMANLFSCLWFNEVERFTPRDQLSFAATYIKLARMNPTKQFRFNMFKVQLLHFSHFYR